MTSVPALTPTRSNGTTCRLPVVALLLAAAALLLSLAFAAGPARAATYSDPAGDNCKMYFVQFCGADISAASDSVASDGSVHLTVSSNAANCVGNGLDSPGDPRFGIYASSAVLADFNELGEINGSGSTWAFRGRTPTTTPVTVTTQVAGSTTTWDVTLPASVVATLGTSFKWLAGNGCIGELPVDASDVIPDAGLFTVGGAATPITGVAATTTANRAARSLVAPRIAKLLATGGVNMTVNAPAAGTVAAKLTAKKGTRTVVVGKASATLTRSGKKTIKVALTRAGRALLKGRNTALTAKLTVTYKSGTVTGTATRTLTFRPAARPSGSKVAFPPPVKVAAPAVQRPILNPGACGGAAACA